MSALNVSEADIHVLGHKEVIFFFRKRTSLIRKKRERSFHFPRFSPRHTHLSIKDACLNIGRSSEYLQAFRKPYIVVCSEQMQFCMQ